MAHTSTVLKFFHTLRAASMRGDDLGVLDFKYCTRETNEGAHNLLMALVTSVAFILKIPVIRKSSGSPTIHHLSFAFSLKIDIVVSISSILSCSPIVRYMIRPIQNPYKPSIPNIFVAGKADACMKISSPISCNTLKIDCRTISITPIVTCELEDARYRDYEMNERR